MLTAALATAVSLPAAPASAELASAEGLKAAGVTCRRVELQALTASVEIDVAVDESKAPGKYLGAECVVLKQPVTAGKLVAADAAATQGDTVARRAGSEKIDPAFLVLGREYARAYLAFEFAVADDAGGTVTRRYLLPVSAVGARTAAAPPPADASREAPFLK